MKRLTFHFASCALLIAGFSLITRPAHAILELRGGYSTNQMGASDINGKFSTAPELKEMMGYNADAILSLPLFPLGFGVRYEDMSKKSSNSTSSIDADLKRVSLLINSRFINTIAYLGVIGTVGVSNKFDYKITTAGVTTDTTASGISGTAGVEAGLKLGFFLLGGEVGYLYAPLGKLQQNGKDYTTLSGSTVEAKLDGVYARGTVGFSF